MQVIKTLFPTLLAFALLVGCGKADTPAPTAVTAASSIQVMVSEAGAPAYDLREARLGDANYHTGATSLSLSGKLNNGKPLVLYFTKGNATASYTTTALSSNLDGTMGSSSVGTTTYNPQTRTVSGTFRTTFAIIGEVSGSFADIQL